MNRRDLLKAFHSAVALGMAGAVPGLTLISETALAGENDRPKRFFIAIRASGGMDVTLGLDPQVMLQGNDENDIFIEYRPDQILRVNESLAFAPSASALAPFASQIAVVNGIYMSDTNISHDANLDYITTGDSRGSSADISVELANASGVGTFGVLANQSVKRGNRVVALNNIQSIESLLKGADLTSLRTKFGSGTKPNAFVAARSALLNGSSMRSKLATAMESLKASLDQTNSQDHSSAHAGVVAAACFASNLAYQAQIEIFANLDTHSAHPGTHMAAQKGVWDQVAEILAVFKSTPYVDPTGKTTGSLLDQTTFMIVSDFSRTPALNAGRGKDHNPLTNSVLLAGAGVAGGRTIGKSGVVPRRLTSDRTPRHAGLPIDYRTGRAAQSREEARNANFDFIFPENVAATIAEIQGVDRSKFGNVALEAQALNAIIRR